MEKKSLLLAFVLIFVIAFVSADENLSLNDSNSGNISASNVSLAVPAIELINFMPSEAKIGDVQLSIQLKNNGASLNGLNVFVTGNGFSTYSAIPADIDSGQKAYVFVMGNFKQSGNIQLKINVLDQTFYKNVSVIDDAANQEKMQQLADQQANQELIKNYSAQLSELKQEYDSLDSELTAKSEGYDVSKVSLSDLKSYIRNLESSILSENTESAKINLKLAQEEYNDQKEKLDGASKKSLMSKLRDNAVLFSTLAGAFIMIFTLYELLKKKKKEVTEIVKSKIANK